MNPLVASKQLSPRDYMDSMDMSGAISHPGDGLYFPEC